MIRYGRVFIEALGYELPPIVVTSTELEERLTPLLEQLHIPRGQIEALTGVNERRWWEPSFPLWKGAAAAGRKALARCDVPASDLGTLIYAGVCRDHFEPATACQVADDLGVGSEAFVYDVSNACLGVLNGMVEIANRIELGQIRAGMVVSCESAREINETTIDRLLVEPNMDRFKESFATFTGGSGAAAVLLTDGSYRRPPRRRLLGGTTRNATEHHSLCRWGLESLAPGAVDRLDQLLPRVLTRTRLDDLVPPVVSQNVEKVLPKPVTSVMTQVMATDSISVLRYGVDLGQRTWGSLLETFGWQKEQIDKVICHQVGKGHQETVLKALGIPKEKDFSTFPYLGNIGTVSLPLTAALAEERGFLQPSNRVGLLGIGSGLNCLMLGVEW